MFNKFIQLFMYVPPIPQGHVADHVATKVADKSKPVDEAFNEAIVELSLDPVKQAPDVLRGLRDIFAKTMIGLSFQRFVEVASYQALFFFFFFRGRYFVQMGQVMKALFLFCFFTLKTSARKIPNADKLIFRLFLVYHLLLLLC